MARVKHGRGHNRAVSYFWVQNAYVETSSANSAMPPSSDTTRKKKKKDEEARAKQQEAEKQAKRVRREAERMANLAEESPEEVEEQVPSVIGVLQASSSQRGVSPPLSQLTYTPDTIPDVVAKGIILKDTLRISRIMRGNKSASKPSVKEPSKGVGALWYIAVYQSLAKVFSKGSNVDTIDKEIDCFKKVILPHSHLNGQFLDAVRRGGCKSTNRQSVEFHRIIELTFRALRAFLTNPLDADGLRKMGIDQSEEEITLFDEKVLNPERKLLPPQEGQDNTTMKEYHFFRESWYMTYQYGKEQQKPDIDNCFTPLFFVFMNFVFDAFDLDQTLRRIANCYPQVSFFPCYLQLLSVVFECLIVAFA